MPPSAADGGSYDERDDDSDTENERRRLPSTCSLLLLHGEVLLSVQLLLLLGELLFGGNSSLTLLSGVAEQGISVWRIDEKRRDHEHDADEGFHMNVPFLDVGTKNPAPFENRSFVGLMIQVPRKSRRLNLCTCYILYPHQKRDVIEGLLGQIRLVVFTIKVVCHDTEQC